MVPALPLASALLLPVAGVAAPTAPAAPGTTVVQAPVVGDGIPEPLTGAPGDPVRGRAIVADRRVGLCLLCHAGPFPDQRFQGNLAPDLAGAGARLSPAQLRLRIVDSRRLDPRSVMPAYHRSEGLRQVGRAWQDRPILSAQQVEDVVAFLATLK